MKMFFDKIANIYQTTIVNIGGEDTKSYYPLYTSKPCDFYTPKNKYSSNNQAREFENTDLEVVFDGYLILVKKGYKINLVDSVGVDFGNYVINDVIFWKNINGKIDNTHLKVTQVDAG